MYSMQHYVIKFVSFLRHVSGFLRVSSTNKTDRHDVTEILLKMALNTINQTKINIIVLYSLGVNPAVTAIQQSGSASNSPVSGDGKQEKVGLLYRILLY